MSSSNYSSLSPDDIVWRTALLHPPKSDISSSSSNINNNSSNNNNNNQQQISARCLEMAGGPSLEWRMVVSEKSYPDGKQEVRIRNPKLSSAIAQPLVPPIALLESSSSSNNPSAMNFSSPNNKANNSGSTHQKYNPHIHFHAACLSMCIIPDKESPQQKTALWCGWSSGHVSVHLVGGKSAGEVVECFVAHRGGPVRMLKSMSCEMASNSPFHQQQGSNTNNSSNDSSILINRCVLSASSDFSVTFWDSQSMKPLKTVHLGPSLGLVRSVMLDRFALYVNDVTESPILTRKSLCIVGADNGSLIAIDLKKELMTGHNQNHSNNSSYLSERDHSVSTTKKSGSSFSNIYLVNQRTAVTSLSVLHFADSPSVCISGSDGGVVRAQALATVGSSSSSNNNNNSSTINDSASLSSSTTSSSTISLQHGAINALAVLPTSSLPQRAVGRGGASGGANLVLAACASGRIFILLVGAGGAPDLRPNTNDIAPLLSAVASFVSPTGPVVQLCSRPNWSRTVYAVTNSGGVDLYASSEAVLNKIEYHNTNSSSKIMDTDDDGHHEGGSRNLQQLPPSQMKTTSMSLIMQTERRYEQNMQLLLDLAVESKRHCEDRDGAVLRLQEENDEKTRILEAMTKQCETLTTRIEQLRQDNSKLESERNLILDHANQVTSTGSSAKHDADILARELQAATDRENNTAALMDQLRTRVISLERELDQSGRNSRNLQREVDIEKTRNEELENALRIVRNNSGGGGGTQQQQYFSPSVVSNSNNNTAAASNTDEQQESSTSRSQTQLLEALMERQQQQQQQSQ